jgi:hypothetical protein
MSSSVFNLNTVVPDSSRYANADASIRAARIPRGTRIRKYAMRYYPKKVFLWAVWTESIIFAFFSFYLAQLWVTSSLVPQYVVRVYTNTAGEFPVELALFLASICLAVYVFFGAVLFLLEGGSMAQRKAPPRLEAI